MCRREGSGGLRSSAKVCVGERVVGLGRGKGVPRREGSGGLGSSAKVCVGERVVEV